MDCAASGPPLSIIMYCERSARMTSPTVPRVAQYSTGITGRPKSVENGEPAIEPAGR
jgi:hypothetical protein